MLFYKLQRTACIALFPSQPKSVQSPDSPGLRDQSLSSIIILELKRIIPKLLEARVL